MRTLNVRLSAEDEEAMRVLRRAGVEVSAVVRAALRTEAERLRGRTEQSARELLAKIYAEVPEPVAAPARRYDVHDRRAFAAAMRAHVRGTRAADSKRRR